MKKKLAFSIALLLSLPFSQAIFERITSKFRSGNFFSGGNLTSVAGLLFLVAAVVVIASWTSHRHSGHPEESWGGRMKRYGNAVVGTAQRHPRKAGALIGLAALGVGGFFAWPFIAPVIGIAGAAAPFVGAAAPWVGGAAGIGTGVWGVRKARNWYNSRHMTKATMGTEKILDQLAKYEEQIDSRMKQLGALEAKDIEVISALEGEIASLRTVIKGGIQTLEKEVTNLMKAYSLRKKLWLVRDDVVENLQAKVDGINNQMAFLEMRSEELDKLLDKKYQEIQGLITQEERVDTVEEQTAEKGTEVAKAERRFDITELKKLHEEINDDIKKNISKEAIKALETKEKTERSGILFDELAQMEDMKLRENADEAKQLERDIIILIEVKRKTLTWLQMAERELLRGTKEGKTIENNEFLSMLDRKIQILKSPELQEKIKRLEGIHKKEHRLRKKFEQIEEEKNKLVELADRYSETAIREQERDRLIEQINQN